MLSYRAEIPVFSGFGLKELLLELLCALCRHRHNGGGQEMTFITPMSMLVQCSPIYISCQNPLTLTGWPSQHLIPYRPNHVLVAVPIHLYCHSVCAFLSVSCARYSPDIGGRTPTKLNDAERHNNKHELPTLLVAKG